MKREKDVSPLGVVSETVVSSRSVWVVLGFHAVARQQERKHFVRFPTRERLRTTTAELTLHHVKLPTHRLRRAVLVKVTGDNPAVDNSPPPTENTPAGDCTPTLMY